MKRELYSVGPFGFISTTKKFEASTGVSFGSVLFDVIKQCYIHIRDLLRSPTTIHTLLTMQVLLLNCSHCFFFFISTGLLFEP